MLPLSHHTQNQFPAPRPPPAAETPRPILEAEGILRQLMMEPLLIATEFSNTPAARRSIF